MADRPIAQVGPHVLVRGDAAAGVGGGEAGPSVGFPVKRALVKKIADATGQNFSAGVPSISFDEEVIDTDGFHDNSTNNDRLTVPADITKVIVRGQVGLSLVASSTQSVLSIQKNGANMDPKVEMRMEQVNTDPNEQIVSYIINVVEGDYFTLHLNIPTDSSVTVSENRTWFSIESYETSAPSTTRRGALVHNLADLTGQDHSAGAVISWDSEVNGYDTDNIHSTSVNPSRLVVPVGVSQVRLSGMVALSLVASADSTRLQILKNGSGGYVGIGMQISDVTFTTPWTSCEGAVIDVVAGDYFELWLDMEGDTSITIIAQSWFSMEIIQPGLIAGITEEGPFVGFPFKGAMVNLSTDLLAQNHSAGGFISFDTETYDIGDWHDNSVNPTRLTVPAGVTKVRLMASVWVLLHTANQYISISLRKNGSTSLGMGSSRTEVGTNPQMFVSSLVVEVVEGDYFEILCDTEADTSITIASSQTAFGIEAIETVAPSTTRRGALVHDTAAQSIPTGVATIIDFDSEEYDTDGIHDNATNNTRLTVPPGVTQVKLHGNVHMTAMNNNKLLQLSFDKNGSGSYAGRAIMRISTFGSDDLVNLTSTVLDVVPGDYFELSCFHNDTVARSTTGATGIGTWFSMEIIQPTLVAQGSHRACLVTDASTQSLPNNTWTAINFDTTEYDDAGIHDDAVNNTRLTVPAGVSKVRCQGQGAFAADPSNGRAHRITKNGAHSTIGLPRAEYDTVVILEGHNNILTAVMKVIPGDYFEFEMWHNEGSALNTLNNNTNPWFQMEIIE
ncbi:MAG: hypothetical protein V3S55_03860 [Nitrospiraceae bacterium]